MPDVFIPTPSGQMPAWLAAPSNSGPVPGVVILHDIFGMTQDHRNQAKWLAEAGFQSLSVDLYYQGGMLRCVRSVMREIMARLAQPNSNGKAGAIGFCMGGRFALMLASGHGFSAASVNYGGKHGELEEAHGLRHGHAEMVELS
jgi:carboxymethylenebutenolidase